MRLNRLFSSVLLIAAAQSFAADLVISTGGSFNLGTASQTFGQVSCMGTLELTAGAVVNATSSVMLGGCMLQVDVPAGGMPMGNIALVDNMGMMRVMGMFAGISQGMALMIGGRTYYMDYMGGDGNDVVLSTMPVPNTVDGMGMGMMPRPMPGMNVQDMWWTPYESGWGMSLIDHGRSVFGALYIYDANGNPTWVVMPAGTWDSSHTVLTGAVFAPRGAPFFSYDAAHLDVGAAAGNVTITFQDYNGATVDYAIGGSSGRKYVVREPFGGGASMYRDSSDLWWGGMSQNGWGLTVMQKASTLFSVWFTYDADGTRMWYVMPGGAWTSDTTYEGHVYRTKGTPWAAYDPQKLEVTDAGTYRMVFTASGMSFEYSVDGHAGTVPLSREAF